MKIYAKCDACRIKKLFIRQRKYIIPALPKTPVLSNGELCGRCFRSIKKLTKTI